MNTNPFAFPPVQYRRFFRLARGYWNDGRYSGLVVSRRSCYRAAAERIGLPSALFERLFNACFADRLDSLHALNDFVTCGPWLVAASKGDANDRTAIRPTHRVDAGRSRVGTGIVRQALELRDQTESDRGAPASRRTKATRGLDDRGRRSADDRARQDPP